jgi:hypothetical protein
LSGTRNHFRCPRYPTGGILDFAPKHQVPPGPRETFLPESLPGVTMASTDARRTSAGLSESILHPRVDLAAGMTLRQTKT